VRVRPSLLDALSSKRSLTRILAQVRRGALRPDASRRGWSRSARIRRSTSTATAGGSLVEAALPAKARRQRKRHPATRVFQALRIAVNDELGQLERFLDEFTGWLKPGGVICIISYHSLEDRMVKKAFRKLADPCTCPPDLPVCACGKKPLVKLDRRRGQIPGGDEIKANPRARSARLRTAIRTEARA
jgi:16S rRNA (cytosine(1402)-N(4))-methyltransferase